MLVGELFQASFETYCVDQLGVNVLHYLCTNATAGNTYDAGDLKDDLVSRIPALYKPIMVSNAEYVMTRVQRLLPTLGAPVLSTYGAGFGTVLGDTNAKQIAGIITKRTALGGSKYRGRVYLPFTGENSNSATGIPTSTYQADALTLANALFAPITISSHTGETVLIKPVVFSRKPPIASTLITAWAVQQKWANQRRRGSYGRINARPSL